MKNQIQMLWSKVQKLPLLSRIPFYIATLLLLGSIPLFIVKLMELGTSETVEGSTSLSKSSVEESAPIPEEVPPSSSSASSSAASGSLVKGVFYRMSSVNATISKSEALLKILKKYNSQTAGIIPLGRPYEGSYYFHFRIGAADFPQFLSDVKQLDLERLQYEEAPSQREEKEDMARVVFLMKMKYAH